MQTTHLYNCLLGIAITVLIPRQRNKKTAFKNIAIFVYEFKGPAVTRATYVRGLHASLASACATNFPAVVISGCHLVQNPHGITRCTTAIHADSETARPLVLFFSTDQWSTAILSYVMVRLQFIILKHYQVNNYLPTKINQCTSY